MVLAITTSAPCTRRRITADACSCCMLSGSEDLSRFICRYIAPYSAVIGITKRSSLPPGASMRTTSAPSPASSEAE